MRVFAITHRVPFPPNKGEKIRSYHLLKRLAERARVHLFATADPASDVAFEADLQPHFASVSLFPIRLTVRKAASLLFLPTPLPLTLPAFFSYPLWRALKRRARAQPPDVLLLESSSTGSYLRALPQVPAVMDFVDVDSEKWRAYAGELRGPGRLVYRREAWTLRAAERRIAQRSAVSIVTTEREADTLRAIAPTAHVEVVRNGVDTAFFRPRPERARDEPLGVVFFGAMDYPPNADAARFFHDQVLPRLSSRYPDLRFVVAGSKPGPEVRALAETPGVTVTGFVDDIRPPVQRCHVCVIPLRVARGVQNKVLEAMAMGLPVVASSAAAAGIEGRAGDELIIADTADEIDAAVSRLLDDDGERIAQARRGRAFVEQAYGWEPQAKKLHDLLSAACG
jgi:sugar transferase (PEP-CTERM/EpsH1 system associated)